MWAKALAVRRLLTCFSVSLQIALSYAVIFGMKTDLNLQGQDYSWCNSIFCKSKTHDLLEAGFTDSYILDI